MVRRRQLSESNLKNSSKFDSLLFERMKGGANTRKEREVQKKVTINESEEMSESSQNEMSNDKTKKHLQVVSRASNIAPPPKQKATPKRVSSPSKRAPMRKTPSGRLQKGDILPRKTPGVLRKQKKKPTTPPKPQKMNDKAINLKLLGKKKELDNTEKKVRIESGSPWHRKAPRRNSLNSIKSTWTISSLSSWSGMSVPSGMSCSTSSPSSSSLSSVSSEESDKNNCDSPENDPVRNKRTTTPIVTNSGSGAKSWTLSHKKPVIPSKQVEIEPGRSVAHKFGSNLTLVSEISSTNNVNNRIDDKISDASETCLYCRKSFELTGKKVACTHAYNGGMPSSLVPVDSTHSEDFKMQHENSQPRFLQSTTSFTGKINHNGIYPAGTTQIRHSPQLRLETLSSRETSSSESDVHHGESIIPRKDEANLIEAYDCVLDAHSNKTLSEQCEEKEDVNISSCVMRPRPSPLVTDDHDTEEIKSKNWILHVRSMKDFHALSAEMMEQERKLEMELEFLKRQEREIGGVVTPSSSVATSVAANYSWQRNIVQEDGSDTLAHTVKSASPPPPPPAVKRPARDRGQNISEPAPLKITEAVERVTEIDKEFFHNARRLSMEKRVKAQEKAERDTKLQEEEEALERARKEQNEWLRLALSNARQILEKPSESEYEVDNNDSATNSLYSTCDEDDDDDESVWIERKNKAVGVAREIGQEQNTLDRKIATGSDLKVVSKLHRGSFPFDDDIGQKLSKPPTATLRFGENDYFQNNQTSKKVYSEDGKFLYSTEEIIEKAAQVSTEQDQLGLQATPNHDETEVVPLDGTPTLERQITSEKSLVKQNDDIQTVQVNAQHVDPCTGNKNVSAKNETKTNNESLADVNNGIKQEWNKPPTLRFGENDYFQKKINSEDSKIEYGEESSLHGEIPEKGVVASYRIDQPEPLQGLDTIMRIDENINFQKKVNIKSSLKENGEDDEDSSLPCERPENCLIVPLEQDKLDARICFDKEMLKEDILNGVNLTPSTLLTTERISLDTSEKVDKEISNLGFGTITKDGNKTFLDSNQIEAKDVTMKKQDTAHPKPAKFCQQITHSDSTRKYLSSIEDLDVLSCQWTPQQDDSSDASETEGKQGSRSQRKKLHASNKRNTTKMKSGRRKRNHPPRPPAAKKRYVSLGPDGKPVSTVKEKVAKEANVLIEQDKQTQDSTNSNTSIPAPTPPATLWQRAIRSVSGNSPLPFIMRKKFKPESKYNPATTKAASFAVASVLNSRDSDDDFAVRMMRNANAEIKKWGLESDGSSHDYPDSSTRSSGSERGRKGKLKHTKSSVTRKRADLNLRRKKSQHNQETTKMPALAAEEEEKLNESDDKDESIRVSTQLLKPLSYSRNMDAPQDSMAAAKLLAVPSKLHGSKDYRDNDIELGSKISSLHARSDFDVKTNSSYHSVSITDKKKKLKCNIWVLFVVTIIVPIITLVIVFLIKRGTNTNALNNSIPQIASNANSNSAIPSQSPHKDRQESNASSNFRRRKPNVPTTSGYTLPLMHPTDLDNSLRMEAVMDVLKRTSREKDLLDPSTPQFAARNWITFEDSLHLEPQAIIFLQRYVMAVLYFSTNGDGWQFCARKKLASSSLTSADCIGSDGVVSYRHLSGTSECNWYGIVCDEELLVITDISIVGNGLSGELHDELAELTYLKVLNLSRNNIEGRLPSYFDKTHDLREINLASNAFTGVIPSSLGIPNKLRTVAFNQNSLTGTIPGELFMSRTIRNLLLNGNNLEGDLPMELFENTSLQQLHIGENKFGGTISPLFGKLRKLQALFLPQSAFTGTLPGSIFSLSELAYLSIEGNHIEGEIPVELFDGNVSLLFLDLENNQLGGSISSRFSELTQLDFLALNGNFLTGTIPTSFEELSSLSNLRLQKNALHGSIEFLCARHNEFNSLEADCKEEISCSCCTTCH